MLDAFGVYHGDISKALMRAPGSWKPIAERATKMTEGMSLKGFGTSEALKSAKKSSQAAKVQPMTNEAFNSINRAMRAKTTSAPKASSKKRISLTQKQKNVAYIGGSATAGGGAVVGIDAARKRRKSS